MTLTLSPPITFNGLPGDDWRVRQVLNMTVDIVAVVWEVPPNWRGYVSIIQRTSGTTVNEGTPYLVMDNAPNSAVTVIRAAVMDVEHLLVVYNDNIAKEIRGMILARSGVTLSLSAGPTTIVASYDIQSSSVPSPVAFTSILGALIYADINDNDWRKGKVLTLSSTSILVGTEQNLAEAGWRHFNYNLIPITSTAAILAYFNRDAGIVFRDRLGTLTISGGGTTLGISAATIDNDQNVMEIAYDSVSQNVVLVISRLTIDVRSYSAVPLIVLDTLTNPDVNDLVTDAYLGANLLITNTVGDVVYEYEVQDDGTIIGLSNASFDAIGLAGVVGSFNNGMFGLICYRTYTPDSRMVIVQSDYTPPPPPPTAVDEYTQYLHYPILGSSYYYSTEWDGTDVLVRQHDRITGRTVSSTVFAESVTFGEISDWTGGVTVLQQVNVLAVDDSQVIVYGRMASSDPNGTGAETDVMLWETTTGFDGTWVNRISSVGSQHMSNLISNGAGMFWALTNQTDLSSKVLSGTNLSALDFISLTPFNKWVQPGSLGIDISANIVIGGATGTGDMVYLWNGFTWTNLTYNHPTTTGITRVLIPFLV